MVSVSRRLFGRLVWDKGVRIWRCARFRKELLEIGSASAYSDVASGIEKIFPPKDWHPK